MRAIRFLVPLAALAFAGLFASIAVAQAQAPTAAGPWTKIPALPTGCFQYVATNSEDPWYAELEAARAAIGADRDRQEAINAKIEEECNGIDPMEQAQRMQQWMQRNPQEAMAMMQAMQAVPAEAQTLEQWRQAQDAEWKALEKSYDDARIAAYAAIEVRRKALAGRLGYAYSAEPKDLAEAFMDFYEDTGTPTADWNEGESIRAELDRAYKALCPKWWGANGRFHAYMKKQRDRFVSERAAYLEKLDAPRLQQYAIMSAPAGG